MWPVQTSECLPIGLKTKSRDDIHSAVENENTHLLTLQVGRYCPLVLQNCTVAAFPVIEHCVRAGVCHSIISRLVEQNNIHASHLDVPGRC